jgi:hypothetical protein
MKDKVERLNFSVDLSNLRTFYDEIKSSNLKWTFSDYPQQLHPVTVQKYNGYDYKGLPYGWALTSPHDSDTPTSPWAITNYAPGTSKRPTALVTGIVQQILEVIPKSAFELSLTVHPPGAEIVKHSDGNDTLRVHIPLYNTTYFIIDDNGEQTYELVPDGVPYLIDTRYQHRTINPLTEDRVSLIFGIPAEAEEELKSVTGLITI